MRRQFFNITAVLGGLGAAMPMPASDFLPMWGVVVESMLDTTSNLNAYAVPNYQVGDGRFHYASNRSMARM